MGEGEVEVRITLVQDLSRQRFVAIAQRDAQAVIRRKRVGGWKGHAERVGLRGVEPAEGMGSNCTWGEAGL
jgi:hypothetical protein